MNDVILLDSSHACLGANLACNNNEKLEESAREGMCSMVEERPLGEIYWLSVSTNRP